jgi:hypothetical protein
MQANFSLQSELSGAFCDLLDLTVLLRFILRIVGRVQP